MAILTKGQTFADGDQVTSAKLNNLVDQATFKPGAVDGTTMLVDAGGYLKAGTMQTGNLATGSVTTPKIADLNVTTGKIADASITPAKLTGGQAGDAPIFGVRAWVVFDMTRNAANVLNSDNTTRFIKASGNVASVTKNATGEFTVAFTTAMPDVNYGYFAAGMDDDTTGDVIIGRPLGGTKTTTELKLKATHNAGSAKNYAEISVSIIR
jgi:hypothetical protein